MVYKEGSEGSKKIYIEQVTIRGNNLQKGNNL